ncbi:MAG: hypothetical protein MJ061_06445, partial [Mailhella sp.]|nr:hypothetical protein [Mailhella sp.]
MQGAPEAQQEINRICLFGRYDDCERLVLYRPMLLETYVPADRKNDFVAFSSESGRRNYFAHVDGIRTTVSEASAANRTLIAQVKSLDRLEQQLSRINHWRLVTFHNHLKRFEPITKGFELARKIMAKNKPYISGSSNPFGVFLYDARLEGVVSAKGVVGPGIFNSFSDLSAQYVSHLLFLQGAKKELDAVANGLDEAIAARNKARRVLARKLPQEYAKPMA